MPSATLRRAIRFLAILFALPASLPALQLDDTVEPARVGVLVMAHGGDETWNEAVRRAVAPVAEVMPTAVAFGMADPATLGAALDSLESVGVTRVAVVRMFLSGASFLDQTEYLLGLSQARPDVFIPSHAAHGAGDGDPSGAAPSPLDTDVRVATHQRGMADAQEVREIAVQRALAVSDDPERESVLLLAHGMGDEALNDALLDRMGEIREAIAERSFAAVRAATLREDWDDARAVAEEEIRSFVRSENDAGRRVLVVPLRLSGFGPYAEVLDGLDYVAGEGILPHEEATEWVMRVACAILCAEGWESPLMALLVERDGGPGAGVATAR
jgi:hypothetical protein